MSLNDIQLSPVLVQDLYKNTLVETTVSTPEKGREDRPPVSFLGHNDKRITILVNEPGTTYLADEHLSFLMDILTACKLGMADVALVNMNTDPSLTDKKFGEILAPEKLLLFGVEPLSIGMPLQFPHYQVQTYNNCTYLFAPPLAVLKKDKDEKMQLWTCLKKIFLNG